MALTLNKVISRNSANTISTTSNYNELNSKAGTLTDNVVSHVEAQISATEGYVNSVTGTLTTQIGSLVNPSATGYNSATANWRDTMMSKAEFNAMTKQEARNSAGSGAINFGKGNSTTALNVNEGIHTSTTAPNTFYLGKVSGTGTSSTDAYIASINGSVILAKYLNTTTADATLLLPPAPTVLPSTATLTQQQIDSGVIKHADASNSGLITGGTGLTGTTFTQTINTVNGKKYIIEYVDSTVRKTLEVTASASTYAVSLSGTDITRVAVFQADATSRSDLVFLKKNVVDVTVNDFYYPLGNRQYLGTTADGLSTVSGAFASAPTYSLFSDVWQADSALIGKGFVWSTLSDANKKTVVANYENNSYLDGDKVYQAQHIAQVAMMKGDYFTEATAFAELGYTVDTVDKGLYRHADGSEAIGIALVHRRNQGFMHPVYNPNGTKLASDSLPWYSTTVSFTSIADCFTDSKLLTASGYIGTTTGRADLLFYDQVSEMDITDLRMSSQKVEDYNRLIDREFNKAVAGTTRGSEGEWSIVENTNVNSITAPVYTGGFTYFRSSSAQSIGSANSSVLFYDQSYSYKVKGNSGVWYNCAMIQNSSIYLHVYVHPSYGNVSSDFTTSQNYAILISKTSTRTKSNTITHCDIIGNPANYPTAWKQSGVFGTPLIVAEDGTSLLPTGTTGSDGLATFKLSHDANTTPLQVLKSTDSGVTWTALSYVSSAPTTGQYTFSTTTNSITIGTGSIPLATDLIRVTYQTYTNMLTTTTNATPIAIGKSIATNGFVHGRFISSLIAKIPTASTSPYAQFGYSLYGYRIDATTLKFSTTSTEFPLHTAFTLAGGALGVATVKAFPYLTSSNGKAYVNIPFKEMKHNGTSYGDDGKFNIVDNITTTTDNNALAVLTGTKRIELPYFISASE